MNLIGKKFGKLTVLSKSTKTDKGYKTYWDCKCYCGNLLTTRGSRLNQGNVKSCGCLLKEFNFKTKTKHGMSHSEIHQTWCKIIERCYNLNDKNYGGRGIKVCKQWQGKNGFVNFYKDMGDRPNSKYSIDRINNNGNYTPSNCRWATAKEQANNRRNNTKLKYNGKNLTISQWSERLNIYPELIINRLKREWSIKDSLTKPIGNSAGVSVSQFTKDGKFVKKFSSIRKAIDFLNLSSVDSAISAACRGKKKMAHSYIWRYSE